MGVRPWAVAALVFTGVAGVGGVLLSYVSVRRRQAKRRDSLGKTKEGNEEGERMNRTGQDGCGSTQAAVMPEDPQGKFGKELGVEERKREYVKSVSEKDSADAGGHTPARSNVWELEDEDRYTSAGGKEVTEFEIQMILAKDKKPVSEFWRNKYETEARRMWDVFYRVNQANFFKDRHYLDKEWDVLRSGPLKILDAGCGVGNTALPLLQLNSQLMIWACDFSDNAVELLKKSEVYDEKRCTAFVSDITRDSLAETVGEGEMDLCMLIFVLSAINPDKFVDCMRNVARALRVGGEVLFRDYGLYDMAQLKMAEPKGHKISDNFYVRKDGTRAYYFGEDELIRIFEEAGFKTVQCDMHKRAVSNRKDGTVMHRRWIQARFVKV